MSESLTARLTQLIGQYGVQCSETKELAPSTELSKALDEIDMALASLRPTSAHITWDDAGNRIVTPIDRPPATPRDCKHGNLARSCEMCFLESELAEARAELDQKDITIAAKQHLLEQERKAREGIQHSYNIRLQQECKRADSFQAKLAASEAREAALREELRDIASQIDKMGTSVTVATFGNALLNRIDAARAGKESDRAE